MKPMSWWTLLMFRIAEPFQIIHLGGSSMAWIRFVGESNHNIGHSMLRLGGNPEVSLMGCKSEQVREWCKTWGQDVSIGIGGRSTK